MEITVEWNTRVFMVMLGFNHSLNLLSEAHLNGGSDRGQRTHWNQFERTRALPLFCFFLVAL